MKMENLKEKNAVIETIIAACGNDCAVCPRYTAHPYEKSDEELHRTAELWMKIGYRDHVVSTCGECFEYPCDNIKECFAVTKSFEPMCRQACTDDEYKRLEKAFFEKEKNLSDKMVKSRFLKRPIFLA